MPFTIYITRDFDQVSQVAAEVVEAGVRDRQAGGRECVLGLATGNSPSGLYKHLAKAFNAGRIDPGRVRSFNLDEYVGLPGENAQQRALHPESYSYFMVSEFFALLERPFAEANVPWGALIDQGELVRALESSPGDYEMVGADRGKAIVIAEKARGVLRVIKDEVLGAYARKIEARGGIDLQVLGVGERGHVAFHECGIPFDASPVLLVKLDDNTVENSVTDKHFESVAENPPYAVSMGAGLIYRAGTVVLVANGERKTRAVLESVLGPVTCDVPASYCQSFSREGGTLAYVVDEVAAAGLIPRLDEVEARGFEVVDARGRDYRRLSEITFSRNPDTGHLR